jgi:hypothetical protein
VTKDASTICILTTMKGGGGQEKGCCQPCLMYFHISFRLLTFSCSLSDVGYGIWLYLSMAVACYWLSDVGCRVLTE